MKFTINLNGLFLVPYQLLIDLSEQISNPPRDLKRMLFSPICELNETNDWINLEALGKPVAIRAKQMCDMVLKQVKRLGLSSITLEIELGTSLLTSDNLYALMMLAEHLDKLEVNFGVIEENRQALHEKMKSLADFSNVFISLSNSSYKKEQQKPNMLLELETIRYRLMNQIGFPFHANWFEKQEITLANHELLIGYAWVCMKTGAYEISTNILSAALNQAVSNEVHEALFIQLQVIRFLSHQYVLLTETPFPEQFNYIDEDNQKSIYFLKAYAATLSRNLTVAKQYFDKSHIHEKMVLTDEQSLYQLNLFALYQVLSGNTETAFELEQRIETFVAQHDINVAGLKYVNFINIARLYKKVKQFDTSLAYYEKAYDEIRGGGYTNSDHIYYNMNLGSLYEAKEAYETALAYWLKAVLHWLASPNPYELSWRPRIILCKETTKDIVTPLSIDKVNQFFVDKLKELLVNNQLEVDASSNGSFQFKLASHSKHVQRDTCYIKNHIIVYGSHEMFDAQEGYLRESTQVLNHLASSLVQRLMKVTTNHMTLLVDDEIDQCFPLTDKACKTIAYIAGCTACVVDGKRLDDPQDETTDFLTHTNVSLSASLKAIKAKDEKLHLEYKRSFMNQLLQAEDEIKLVHLFERNKSQSLDSLIMNDENAFKRLYNKRVLTLSNPR